MSKKVLSNKERATKHAEEISNYFVPKLHTQDPQLLAEIRKMPIRDIISIWRNANYAMNKGIFVGVDREALKAGETTAKRFDASISQLEIYIIDRLKKADALWTITDKITQMPYFDHRNYVWIFTEREIVQDCLVYSQQQGRTTFEITEIKKEEIYNFLGRLTYIKGAEMFVVDMGAYASINIPGKDMIDEPDFEYVPETERPVVNPDLFRMVAQYQQEKYYLVDYPGKAEALEELENKAADAFCKAGFLVPVIGMERVIRNTKTTADISKKMIKVPFLSRGEGENKQTFTPVFTDWDEFKKMYSPEEFGGLVWTAEDLLDSQDDMFVVNPASLRYEISKQKVREILNK